MKSLSQSINESSKDTSVLSMFKDDENSILSMIVKRIENWDANNKKYSREPMFLTCDNFNFMGWSRISILSINLKSGKQNADLFDGFLKEYIEHKSTPNEKYILGVFIDRCFIPIPDKETFDKIWNKLNKQ